MRNRVWVVMAEMIICHSERKTGTEHKKAVELAGASGREPCSWGEVAGQSQAKNLPDA